MKKFEVQFVSIEKSHHHAYAKDFFRAFDEDDYDGMKLAAHEIYANNDDVRIYEWEEFDTLEEAEKVARSYSGFRTFNNCGMRWVDIFVGEVHEMTYDEDGELDEIDFLNAYEM